jgi:HNH endonuclease
MKTLHERFWAKVESTGGPQACWLWTGAKLPKGYGVIRRGQRGAGYIYAHRVSYELRNGSIPAGLSIDHLCRNTSCVNPDHLEAVPIKVNLLRGESLSAQYARRTHCKAGHPLNHGLFSKGHSFRRCKVCVANYMRQYRLAHPRRPEAQDDNR